MCFENREDILDWTQTGLLGFDLSLSFLSSKEIVTSLFWNVDISYRYFLTCMAWRGRSQIRGFPWHRIKLLGYTSVGGARSRLFCDMAVDLDCFLDIFSISMWFRHMLFVVLCLVVPPFCSLISEISDIASLLILMINSKVGKRKTILNTHLHSERFVPQFLFSSNFHHKQSLSIAIF